jgi:hypothetical protein
VPSRGLGVAALRSRLGALISLVKRRAEAHPTLCSNRLVFREPRPTKLSRHSPLLTNHGLPQAAQPLISKYVREASAPVPGSYLSIRICFRNHLPSIFWPEITSNFFTRRPCAS